MLNRSRTPELDVGATTAAATLKHCLEGLSLHPHYAQVVARACEQQWSPGECLGLLKRIVGEPQLAPMVKRYQDALLSNCAKGVLASFAPIPTAASRSSSHLTVRLPRNEVLHFEIESEQASFPALYHVSANVHAKTTVLLPQLCPDAPYGRPDSELGPVDDSMEGSFGSCACVCAAPSIEACLRSIAGYSPSLKSANGQLSAFIFRRDGFFSADNMMILDAESTAEMRSFELVPAQRIGVVRWRRARFGEE